jgi:hypothetical protein
MTQTISPESANPDRPYEHLAPIVSMLLANGNALAVEGDSNAGFYLTQGGWMCDLKKPIDFGLVEREFDLPPTIKTDKGDQSIFCQSSWIVIRGNVG